MMGGSWWARRRAGDAHLHWLCSQCCRFSPHPDWDVVVVVSVVPAAVSPISRPSVRSPLPRSSLAAGMDTSGEIAARGFEEASKGNFRCAVDWFTSALDLNRQDFASLANRSLCFYQMNRFDEAAADAHRAIQLRPLEPKGHYLLARALLALKRFREAERAISQAARLLPADPMQPHDDFQIEVLRMQCLTATAAAEVSQPLDARTTVSSDSGHSSPSGDESYPPSSAPPSTKRNSSDLTNSHASFPGESAWSHFRNAKPLFGDTSNCGFGVERDSVWSSNKTAEQSGWPDFNATAFSSIGNGCTQLRLSSDPLFGLGQMVGGGCGSANNKTVSRPGSAADMHPGSLSAKSGICDFARVQNILHFKAIFVDNVSAGVTMEKMMETFSVYGLVVAMAVKPVLGNAATFAVVEYADFESPENAVTDAMNNPLLREGVNFDLKQPLSVKFTPSASERRSLSSGCQARSWAQNVIERSGECFEWRFASSCSLGKNCFRKHIVRHRQIDTLKSFTL